MTHIRDFEKEMKARSLKDPKAIVIHRFPKAPDMKIIGGHPFSRNGGGHFSKEAASKEAIAWRSRGRGHLARVIPHEKSVQYINGKRHTDIIYEVYVG